MSRTFLKQKSEGTHSGHVSSVGVRAGGSGDGCNRSNASKCGNDKVHAHDEWACEWCGWKRSRRERDFLDV